MQKGPQPQDSSWGSGKGQPDWLAVLDTPCGGGTPCGGDTNIVGTAYSKKANIVEEALKPEHRKLEKKNAPSASARDIEGYGKPIEVLNFYSKSATLGATGANEVTLII